MRNLAITTAFLTVLVLAGCFELDEEYVVNPDLSGKLNFEINYKPVNPFNTQQDVDLEQAGRTAVKDMLAGSRGVETWKDVKFEPTDDGKVKISGTAYFKDIGELKMKYGNMKVSMDLAVKKLEDGSLVIEPDKEQDEDVETPEMTDEEIQAAIKKRREQYANMKMMFVPMMEGMKTTRIYRLPGTLEEVINFEKLEGGALV